MEGKRFRVGSVAVLFAVVAVCVAIFCILTAVTAVSDQRMARQYGDHIAQVYRCQNRGQEWLAQADAWFAGLGDCPADSVQENETLQTEIYEGNVTLKIAVEPAADGYRILQRECTTQWQPEQEWILLQ